MIDVVARSEGIYRGTADVIFSDVIRTIRLPDGATPVHFAGASDVFFSVDAHRSILTDTAAFRFVLRGSQEIWIDDAVIGFTGH